MNKLLSLLILIIFSVAQGYDQEVGQLPAAQMPTELSDVGLATKVGTQIDLNLEFRNESGNLVPLKEYFKDGKPVLISLVYFSCPSLCNLHLNNATDIMRELQWTVGKEFRYLAISFEPKDTPPVAASKKQAYLKSYGRPQAQNGWMFLTGDEKNIKALTQSLGFKYKWMPEANEWAHPSAITVLTAKGQVAQSLQGMQTDSQNLKFALMEASDGKLGNIIENIVLFCFRYDPHKSRYTLYAFNVMRAGAGLTILLLGLLLVPFWIRQRRHGKSTGKGVSK